MSDAPRPGAPPSEPPPPADPHAHGGASHTDLRGLLTGFVLSVVLTALAFWLVMGKVLAHSGATITVILTLAVIQIVVHMVYFLHLDTRSEGGWNLLALLFTAVLVLIVLSGSLWVMYHLHYNMMPGHALPQP